MIKSKLRLTSRASSFLDINLLGRVHQRLCWQPDISFVLASSMFTADRESSTPSRPWVLSSANKVEYPVINLHRSEYVELERSYTISSLSLYPSTSIQLVAIYCTQCVSCLPIAQVRRRSFSSSTAVISFLLSTTV